MSRDLPIEQYVFDLWSLPDVVLEHVAPASTRSLIHDNSNMRHISAQVPGDQVARRVVLRALRNRQRLSPAAKKHHQVRYAPVIDISIRMEREPPPSPRIRRKIPFHIFVHFFLQIDANRAVDSNNLIRAHTGVRGHIPVCVRNPHRSEEHTSELQSRLHLVCRLLLEKKKTN